MRNRVYSESDPEQDETGANPNRSPKRRPEIANEQKGGRSGDLIRRSHPGSLTACERKPTLYRRNGHTDQTVDYHRLEKRREAYEQKKPTGAGQKLEAVGTTSYISKPSLELAAVVRFDVLGRCARSVDCLRHVGSNDVVGGLRVRHEVGVAEF